MKLVFEMKNLGIRNGNILWGKLHLLKEKDALEVLRAIACIFMQKVWLEAVIV
jgi:hypothetical protein